MKGLWRLFQYVATPAMRIRSENQRDTRERGRGAGAADRFPREREARIAESYLLRRGRKSGGGSRRAAVDDPLEAKDRSKATLGLVADRIYGLVEGAAPLPAVRRTRDRLHPQAVIRR